MGRAGGGGRRGGGLGARLQPAHSPGRVREQQRTGEPARVEQLAGAVVLVQQRRGEQGVAQHGQGERADRGVDRRAVDRASAGSAARAPC